MKTLNIDSFKKLDEHTYTLIHVLPKEHYQSLHIKGSINICVYEANFISKVNELNLDTSSKIILCGEDKNELSAKVAFSKLHDFGFNNVYVLEGGLSEYTDSSDLEGTEHNLDVDQLLNLEDKTYALVEQSTLGWTGENANGKHFGKVNLKSGILEAKESLLSGEFIIDMSSIETLDLSAEDGSEYLNEHLKSDDFFLTKLFPQAKYTFKNIQPLQTPYLTDVNYVLDGELTLKGIKKKQNVNALLCKVDDTLVLNARVELDRTYWDIIYGSSKFFKFLGMHKIFDKVFIEMRLELR